jgi:hypothetical protein
LNILVYHCAGATASLQYMAVTVEKGARLPVVYYGHTEETAREAAENGWKVSLEMAAKKATPRAPKKAVEPGPSTIAMEEPYEDEAI